MIASLYYVSPLVPRFVFILLLVAISLVLVCLTGPPMSGAATPMSVSVEANKGKLPGQSGI